MPYLDAEQLTPYLVIYRVKEETVQIIRLLHASRKYPE
nr:type II toxin-antitoxin system RelE/ParE family toxin [Planktothrix rubescens]